MREINEELVQQLIDQKISIIYGALGKRGDIEGLTQVLKKAFPSDGNPSGTSDYYIASSHKGSCWSGSGVVYYTPVPLEKFFQTEIISSNYQIF
jgi:predicted RNA-binding protein with PUA-like domain